MLKKFFSVSLVVVCGSVVFIPEVYAQAADSAIRLNSADGSTSFQVQDSAGARQMSVDSDGNMILVGSCTIKGTAGMSVNQINPWGDLSVIRSTGDVSVQVDTDNNEDKAFVVRNSAGVTCFVAREDFNFWPRVYERRFYDDANNGVISVSTNLYVAGILSVGSAFPNRLELWSDTGDMRVGGGDLQIGSSWSRRIYDNATNGLLGISTNAYVAGTFGIGSNRILDSAGTRIITTASDATANTTVTTIHGDLRINGNDILDSGGTTRITLGVPATPLTVGGGQSAGNSTIPARSDHKHEIGASVIYSTHIANGQIQSADIGNKQVTSDKLLVTSTFTAGSRLGVPENLTFANLSPFYGVLNVTQVPAVIYAIFTSSCSRTNGTWDNHFFRIMIDGNQAGGDWQQNDGGNTMNGYSINVVAAWRVTTTGNKVVSVQQWHWGTSDFVDCRFSAFWVPVTP